VILEATGQEVLDVHLGYFNGTNSISCSSYLCNSSRGIVPANGTIVPVRITFSNLGDVELNDLTANFSTASPTLIGATASTQTYPLGIIYPTTFHLATLSVRALIRV
jgi:hypothetical protein